MSTTPVTPPIAAPVAAPKRLRILCLHGYAQNGIIFNKKTAVLRKSWDDVADLVYVTAPLRVMVPDLPTVKEREEDTQQEVSEEMSPYAWWFYQPSGVTYKDLESSIAFLKNVLENEGPFDGILGFSQGAVMASLLTGLLKRPPLQAMLAGHEILHSPFLFSIMISGFKAIPPAYAPLYDPPIETPSLHVIGKLDTLVAPERSQLLATCFRRPVVQFHEGGHFVPSNAESRKIYRSFIDRFVSPQLSDAL